MASTSQRDYQRLCGVLEHLGGRIRLAREKSGVWALTVTVSASDEEPGSRAAGFFFPDIVELDRHSRPILAWLSELLPDAAGAVDQWRSHG